MFAGDLDFRCGGGDVRVFDVRVFGVRVVVYGRWYKRSIDGLIGMLHAYAQI